MIDNERIEALNDKEEVDGDYFVYWMQRSQREEYNHALEFAIQKGNELELPVIVYFGITDDFPGANERHYHFMLEGLQETEKSLSQRNIQTVIRKESPEQGILEIAEDAALTIVDKGYLKVSRLWREKVARKIDCPLIEVETDVIVPVEEVTDKEEYAARTIRPKINDELDKFLKPVKKRKVENSSLDYSFESISLQDIDKIISELDINHEVEPSDYYSGGSSEAKKLLKTFVDEKLEGYSNYSNDPSEDYISHLSPYLHFGQISPLYIALKISEKSGEGAEEYLEQLIIRRELAINFTHFNPEYDDLTCIPDWAKETLEEHKNDKREYVYSSEEFEKAKTHDPYWNAAQLEMIETGKMHGYMRMYWGKKILEWSETPEKAYEIALNLNNKYELDGRDPNGYAGVAWCFGNHDQGWKERPIYGKVRYMSSSGLERKFNIGKYVEKIEKISKQSIKEE